jgi:hypothetical protein
VYKWRRKIVWSSGGHATRRARTDGAGLPESRAHATQRRVAIGGGGRVTTKIPAQIRNQSSWPVGCAPTACSPRHGLHHNLDQVHRALEEGPLRLHGWPRSSTACSPVPTPSQAGSTNTHGPASCRCWSRRVLVPPGGRRGLCTSELTVPASS